MGGCIFSALFIKVTKSNQKQTGWKKKVQKEEENFKRESSGSHHWEVWQDPGALSLILGLISAQPFIFQTSINVGNSRWLGLVLARNCGRSGSWVPHRWPGGVQMALLKPQEEESCGIREGIKDTQQLKTATEDHCIDFNGSLLETSEVQ